MPLFRLTGFVLAAAIGWIPIAPPEHVHESEDSGHHRFVVHRHAQPHGGMHHANRHAGRIDDDDDAPLLTLSGVFTVPAGTVLPVAPPAEAAVTIEPPAVRLAHVPFAYVELLIHGPPRAPSSLRAPPALLAL